MFGMMTFFLQFHDDECDNSQKKVEDDLFSLLLCWYFFLYWMCAIHTVFKFWQMKYVLRFIKFILIFYAHMA